jgi:molybdopterin/thiamine biosynthesis adenylyltransferase
LHRQTLHGPGDIGRPKAEAAAAKLRSLFPGAAIDARVGRIEAANAEDVHAPYDFVIDATDNAATKFLLNDVCVLLAKPLVHAGVVGLYGQMMTILPGETACLRCLFPEAPSEDEVVSCQQAGILGPLAAAVGAMEGREAVRYFCGRAPLAAGRLLSIDARGLRVRDVPVGRSARCPACGTRRSDIGVPPSRPPPKVVAPAAVPRERVP